MISSSTPAKNHGIENSTAATPRSAESDALSRVAAASTPVVIPNTTIMIPATTTSSIVTGTVLTRMSETGWPLTKLCPKSRCTRLLR